MLVLTDRSSFTRAFGCRCRSIRADPVKNIVLILPFFLWESRLRLVWDLEVRWEMDWVGQNRDYFKYEVRIIFTNWAIIFKVLNDFG